MISTTNQESAHSDFVLSALYQQPHLPIWPSPTCCGCCHGSLQEEVGVTGRRREKCDKLRGRRRRRRKGFIDERGRRMDLWVEKSRVCGKKRASMKECKVVTEWTELSPFAPGGNHHSQTRQPRCGRLLSSCCCCLICSPPQYVQDACHTCFLVFGYHHQLWEIYQKKNPGVDSDAITDI